MVFRAYVEKKPEFAVEAAALRAELTGLLGITGLASVRLVNRYDVEGIDRPLFDQALTTVFSEPPVDVLHEALLAADWTLAVEYLPGQFDQRADSAAECIQLLSCGERPLVSSARVYLFTGDLSPQDRKKIQDYVINPVEARQAELAPKASLAASYPAPPDVPVLEGFTQLPPSELPGFIAQYGLAMDEADLAFFQDYFKQQERQPTLTELRMVDTYWSDHCRHTTFGTVLQHIAIKDEKTLKAYNNYLNLRKELYSGKTAKPQTLMDLGTIAAKVQRKRGLLKNLDESEEINACSVKVTVDVDGEEQDWLLLYKNETHNHPTEIEPFGGAATCIGGAIRDPLANRGYVFGSMRITGAGSPLQPVGETLPGKLPQHKLCTTAAAGFSSYGNQIGLATGLVKEIYHPGYVAKRMELGAVLGAVPQNAVRRETPQPGDVVLLLGGRTGRDGCGGATGSSKAHQTGSLAQCGAEVQKGNAPVERKLQRLFRNPDATRLIVRCNDFGAGGVSVAIGELADGLRIDLDAVPKKYEGLDGTELAISESQERMAVVVRAQDAPRMMELAAAENLEATRVAVITAEPRLVMQWRGKVIVDIERAFLNSNGAEKTADVQVDSLPTPTPLQPKGATFAQKLQNIAQDLNYCSQKGLAERFDSTIGAGSVLMPFGGKYQLSPTQALVMKLPTPGETTTCAGMAYGFDPVISQQNPYTGAYLAVLDSVARLCAAGFSRQNITLSFQEYFERLGKDATRWGKPFSSLLGALSAQMDLDVAAIGGKDSMSGSFEDLDVPPTLVSFAVAAGKVQNVPCGEFQLPQSRVAWLRPAYTDDGLTPNAASFKLVLAQLETLIHNHHVLSVRAVGAAGAADALFNMCLGNRLGFILTPGIDTGRLFAPAFGSFLVELDGDIQAGETLGETTGKYVIKTPDEEVDLQAIQDAWQSTLEPVFPCLSPSPQGEVRAVRHTIQDDRRTAPAIGVARPRALIPVFPGTNCEYDTARALRLAGAEPEIFVVRNLTPQQVEESAEALARRIAQSQMVVLPGGFSGGDEPEGSAKLINAFFRGPRVAAAVTELLEARDGLMLGICNGFQALVKLGLLPHGKISPVTAESPTLTFNAIGRHQSMLVRTRVASGLSPWLCKEAVDTIHTVAVSHGEGRFVAGEALLAQLAESGQISTQYVDFDGEPTMDVRCNPNGSAWAVEGITSPDGRVFGKMGHSERFGDHVHINVPGNKHQRLFEGGVSYYTI